MSDTKFQPIFDYIDDKVDGLKDELASKKDIERVLDAVGAIAKQSKDHEDKIAILQNKSESIERWVIKASKHNKIPYNA